MPHTEILICQLDDERCALRLGEVVEITAAVEHLALPEAPDVVMGLVNVRGQVATLYDIRTRLGMPPRAPASSDHFIVSQADDAMVVICVDRAIEIATVLERDIADASLLPSRSRCVAGVVKLRGDILLIHSLARFLSQSEQDALTAAMGSISEMRS